MTNFEIFVPWNLLEIHCLNNQSWEMIKDLSIKEAEIMLVF